MSAKLPPLKLRTRNAAWLAPCVDHWSKIIDDADLGCDWDDADKVCWNCGCCRSLQKCHIVPKALGGEDSPQNTVALCAQCHDLAPDVLDEGEIWRWIKGNQAGKSGLYHSYWVEEALSMANATYADVDADKFVESLQKISNHVGQSNGGSRVKASSIAWAIRNSLKKGNHAR
jgi:hypothetical protein